MARQTTPRSLLDLKFASTIQGQIQALRQLKNDLIGHAQRKEACIRSGVVDLLSELLNGALRAGGKRRRLSADTAEGVGSISNGNHNAEVDGRDERRRSIDERWSHEDELKLQCTILIASLAQEGSIYVEPLVLGGILRPLLSSLSPRETPTRLVLATLRALLVFSDARATDIQSIDKESSNPVADELFSRHCASILAEILSQPSTSRAVQEQQSLVAQIITSACSLQHHQQALLKAGVLDLLSGRLAASIVALGFVKPEDSREPLELPPPLPIEDLSHILEAISGIVINSAYRCARFVYSPYITSIFPATKSPSNTSSNGYSPMFGAMAVKPPPQPVQTNVIDQLLPQIVPAYNKPAVKLSTQWPPLATMADYHRGEISREHGHFEAITSPPRTTSQEFNSQLISWLLYMSRSSQGRERLASVWLLVLIIRARDRIFPEPSQIEVVPGRNRDRILANLVVPLLVEMIRDASGDKKGENGSNTMRRLSPQSVKERATSALGLLVEDSPALQKAANDAGAIKLLCQMLKRTFDPVSDTRKPMWSPVPPDDGAEMTGIESPASMRIGQHQVLPEVLHALKRRAGAMVALANIGQVDDGFRKTMIDQGIVTCMVDSLTPYPEAASATSLSNADALDGKKGNPLAVIVAACKLARALSRSVNILRTSLIDGGLAKPVLELLKSPNMEVKRQSTNVMCNLLLQFSPMRDELVRGGCVRELCSHAHSADPELQTMSLWALKHLVSATSTELKISCLEELGVGWLIQIMKGEVRFGSNAAGVAAHKSSTPIGMGTANAAGEQVDLLNAPADEAAMDVDESTSSDEVDEDDEDTKTSPFLPLPLPLPHHRGSPGNAQYRARLKLLKREEQNPAIIAWRHDVRIQNQALDFLRNLIGDAQASHYELIDYVLFTLPKETLFKILLEKLRAGNPQQQAGAATKAPLHAGRELPRPANMPPRATYKADPSCAAAEPGQAIPVRLPSDLLISAIFILVHIANGRPSQRQMLISQKDVIAATLPLFSHPDRLVRLACLWLMQNLLWLDSKAPEDTASARQRARDLRLLGVDEKVREALRDDDLDVHQRAKGVVEALERLLGDGGGGGAGLGAVGERGQGPSQHARHHAMEGSGSSLLARVGLPGGSGSGGGSGGRAWES